MSGIPESRTYGEDFPERCDMGDCSPVEVNGVRRLFLSILSGQSEESSELGGDNRRALAQRIVASQSFMNDS